MSQYEFVVEEDCDEEIVREADEDGPYYDDVATKLAGAALNKKRLLFFVPANESKHTVGKRIAARMTGRGFDRPHIRTRRKLNAERKQWEVRVLPVGKPPDRWLKRLKKFHAVQAETSEGRRTHSPA